MSTDSRLWVRQHRPTYISRMCRWLSCQRFQDQLPKYVLVTLRQPITHQPKHKCTPYTKGTYNMQSWNVFGHHNTTSLVLHRHVGTYGDINMSQLSAKGFWTKNLQTLLLTIAKSLNLAITPSLTIVQLLTKWKQRSSSSPMFVSNTIRMNIG